MTTKKPIYSFDKSERWQAFRKQLADRGVIARTIWQARKDGEAVNSLRNKYPDIEYVMFTGQNISNPLAIVTLQNTSTPEDCGFEIFFPSPNNEYAKDIDTILGKS